MASPFARLPCELVRTIVELAAAAPDGPTTALALTRVSRAVRAWAEPALYHTVVLWTPHTVQLFRAAFAAKPPAFFAAHVRNLFVNGEDAADIILACARVSRLAAYPPALLALPDGDPDSDLDTDAIPSPCAGPVPPCPAPYEVSLMGALEDVPWASPLFARTQHLYLGLEPPSPDTACDLSVLPSLQRLAFPYDDGDDAAALRLTVATLLESTTLRVLLVLVNDPDDTDAGGIWRKLAGLQDPRLFVGTEPSFDGEDWAAMVRDGTSPWDYEGLLGDWRSVQATPSHSDADSEKGMHHGEVVFLFESGEHTRDK